MNTSGSAGGSSVGVVGIAVGSGVLLGACVGSTTTSGVGVGACVGSTTSGVDAAGAQAAKIRIKNMKRGITILFNSKSPQVCWIT
jgi:hypothetical protein